MNVIRAQRHQTVKIVTSGYADRYLKHESVFTLTVDGGTGETAKCKFDSESAARQFCVVAGMEWAAAYEFIRDAQVTITMAGKIDNRQWSSTVVTSSQLHSVEAFLVVRSSQGFQQTYVDNRLDYLNSHPIPSNLMMIVRGQLAECDRINTERWGHPNGQAG